MNGDNLFLGGLILITTLSGFALDRLRRHVRAIPHAKWPLVLLGNLLLLTLLVGMLAVAVEAYFRFGYDTTDSFVQTKVSRQWFARHWRENSAGIRDDENYSNRRTPGRRRITFVGDSFTAGQGVSRMTDRFVNIVRDQHPEWEVHMFAFPGFDTGGETDYLQQVCAKGYELEDVVLVYCLNDLSDLVTAWTNEVQRFQAEWENRSWLRQHSFLADTLAYRISLRNQAAGYFDFVQAAYTNTTWTTQAERLRTLQLTVESHGGRLRVVTFPFLHRLGADYPMRGVHEQLGKFWTERGVTHLDLLPAFESQRADDMVVNRLDAHPNPAAQRIAADAIEKFLVEPKPKP